jgi:TPR repeat protein
VGVTSASAAAADYDKQAADCGLGPAQIAYGLILQQSNNLS